MARKRLAILFGLLPFAPLSATTGYASSLECQTAYAKFAALQANQIALTNTYSACISSDLRPKPSGIFLGFTCEFELNQTVRGQAKVSAALASATQTCMREIRGRVAGARTGVG